jgi:hypothetical protein
MSLREVKEELSKIRGHLVDMPLDFLNVSRQAIRMTKLTMFQEEKYLTEG